MEASIFDLLDSLALGRGAAAFSAADELLTAGERHEVLFYRILRHFQSLSRVAALRDAGFDREAIQAELKMKAFPARKLVEQAGRLGAEGIARRLAVLADTDARMKGMGTLPRGDGATVVPWPPAGRVNEAGASRRRWRRAL